jgi:hypothetical protein
MMSPYSVWDALTPESISGLVPTKRLLVANDVRRVHHDIVPSRPQLTDQFRADHDGTHR